MAAVQAKKLTTTISEFAEPSTEYWKRFGSLLDEDTQLNLEMQQGMFDSLQKTLINVSDRQVQTTENLIKATNGIALAITNANVHLKDLDQANDSAQSDETKTMYILGGMWDTLRDIANRPVDEGKKKIGKEEDNDIGLGIIAGIGAWLAKSWGKKLKSIFITLLEGVTGVVRGVFKVLAAPFKLLWKLVGKSKIGLQIEEMFIKAFKPIKLILKPIMKVFKVIHKFLKPLMGLGKTFGKLFPPIMFVVTLIDGIWGLIKGWANADMISGKPKKQLTIFDKCLAALTGFIDNIVFGIPRAILDILGVKTNLIPTPQQIFKFLTDTIDEIAKLFKGDFSGVKKFISWIGEKISAIWDWFKKPFVDAFDAIANFISSINIKDILKGLLKTGVMGGPIGMMAAKAWDMMDSDEEAAQKSYNAATDTNPVMMQERVAGSPGIEMNPVALAQPQNKSIAAPVNIEPTQTLQNMKNESQPNITVEPTPVVVQQAAQRQAPQETGNTVLGIENAYLQLVGTGML